jgi:PAS domain S-box-containing protein
MAADDNEEKVLRSVALRNANSILRARQRAEREILQAKEALERKTEELAHSLAMMRATLESATDGILVTNAQGEVTGFNQKFVDMWRLPQELMDTKKHRRILAVTAQLFKEPEKFRARIEEIYAASPPESFDLLQLADGRVIERFTRIQFIEERNVGRVWSFRDITERKRAEEELRQQREWFQVTLSSIGDAVITTDTQGKVTFLNPAGRRARHQASRWIRSSGLSMKKRASRQEIRWRRCCAKASSWGWPIIPR